MINYCLVVLFIFTFSWINYDLLMEFLSKKKPITKKIVEFRHLESEFFFLLNPDTGLSICNNNNNKKLFNNHHRQPMMIIYIGHNDINGKRFTFS